MAGVLIHVGFGNYVSVNRVLAVAAPTSAPVQRLVREAKQRQTCVDLTSGRRTKLVAFMDTGHLLLLGIDARRWDARLVSSRASASAGVTGG